MYLRFFFAIVGIVNTYVSSQTIKIKGNPIKGGALQILCEGFPTDQAAVAIYKTSSSSVTSVYNALSTCGISQCFPSSFGRYMFSLVNNILSINISALARNEDEMYWTCKNAQAEAQFKLTVYTLPTRLQFQQVAIPLDLAYNDVVLSCRTDCAYPEPNIQWFYLSEGQTWQNWTSLSVSSFTTGSCSDGDGISSRNITLARYTTWSTNAEATIQFKCGILSFPGLTASMLMSSAMSVAFAVKVSNVQLWEGSLVLTDFTTLDLMNSVSTTLTCVPGTSRPPCVIYWYIDGTKQFMNGTTFHFTPLLSDQGKRVYCKVFNFGNPNDAVSSGRPVLYIKHAPEVSLRVSPANMIQDKPVSIYCDALGVPSVYNFTGFQQMFKGVVIDRGYHSVYGTQVNSSVYLHSTQLQDTGIYTCKVNNGITKAGRLDQTASVEIKVQGRPVYLSKSKQFYGSLGENLDVIVNFYSYPEQTNITVIRFDGFKLTDSTKYGFVVINKMIPTFFYSTEVKVNGTELIVSVQNLTNEDFSSYCISVTNIIGKESFIVTIDKKGPPLPPTNFKMSVSNGVLLLSWDGSANGGSDQYFLIQLASGNNEDWKNQTVVKELDDQFLISEGHYAATVSLGQGLYRCRIIATNAFGSAEPVYWQDPLEIQKQVTDDSQTYPALIVGLVLAAVIMVLIIISTLLIKRERQRSKHRGLDGSKITQAGSQQEGVSYANIAYGAESTRTKKDEQYSSLDESLRNSAKTYDVLASDSNGQ